jgi:hypothetical protein
VLRLKLAAEFSSSPTLMRMALSVNAKSVVHELVVQKLFQRLIASSKIVGWEVVFELELGQSGKHETLHHPVQLLISQHFVMVKTACKLWFLTGQLVL